ncbi:UDP-3-O-(3-hydroxymyristoyl)glucosamine N-acyltransferase [Aliikangiella marina]|uniref:UDP-3-O-acylglucosamine N-acyltransferase n=1 Tax=Aliikangiella marina TaxID=1712262 RepID=A0A545TDW1_9GAMM|nr:UDP-3-O-(3-hydroxymyristoyl)glucosamine N-acyltransferase [Aliikangiella marina]TQV75407.1 UDP-3-O-(3-hydroxymyristoyl)glucosamine N-acyltransferase [Aliikangiella marina]
MASRDYTVAQIAQLLDAQYVGDGEHIISGLAPIDKASSQDISFLSDNKYQSQLSTTQAGCVLVSDAVKSQLKTNGIIIQDPYLGFARVAQLLDTTPKPPQEIHPSAIVHESASIGENVAIEPGVVIGEGVQIGDNVIIGANTTIGESAKIGANSRLYANVSIYHRVVLGENCVIQSGAIIGADGFGYANEQGQWVRIPQTGSVILGNEVDVGANACIDRGALNDTIIGNGVKIDNLCHIAHNVVIGEHTAMAGMTGIAGSTTIGKHCTFSGRSSILGHLFIADKTHVTACSLINRSNKEPGVFSSGTGMQDNKTWRKNVARFRQLDEMAKQLKRLQKQIDDIKGGANS